MKGAYILTIYLGKSINLEIGALGNIYFARGVYFYVGSAMGVSGPLTLENRVKRHVSPSHNKKNRWHIDYFLEDSNSCIVKIYLIPSLQKLECILAQEMTKISDGYIEDFGSSDCGCKSHLVYFKNFIEKIFV